MSETKDGDKLKNKRTLSLKLGSKPIIAPKRNIEAGKTVIVEKKRFKRTLTNENQSSSTRLNEQDSRQKKQIDQSTQIQKDIKSESY